VHRRLTVRSHSWWGALWAAAARGEVRAVVDGRYAVIASSLSPEVRAAVWDLRETGASLRSIARRLDQPCHLLTALVTASGGRRPRERPRQRSALRLSLQEREVIFQGLTDRVSLRSIARRLGRAPSTVLRELTRNEDQRRDLWYFPADADEAAHRRARRPKQLKLHSRPELRASVEAMLQLRWSPQQIAAWLRRACPDNLGMRVSHETIYMGLFLPAGGLSRALTQYLRSGRACRRPRRERLPQGRGQLHGITLISERPAEVAGRLVAGHWEGDLLLGKRGSAVATLVERTSRFLAIVALPDGHTAEKVRAALTTSLGRLPGKLTRSLTWDQGKEMAEWRRLGSDSGVDVYFCYPSCPWQRGTNENTNGLLRQYFPHAMNLNGLTQADVDAVASQLNARPRRVLGWLTPSEKLAAVV
jgi:transposase, IS30 family